MGVMDRHDAGGTLKDQILSECNVDGAVISEIARRYGISPATVYGWRYELKKKSHRTDKNSSTGSQFIELVPAGDDASNGDIGGDSTDSSAPPAEPSERSHHSAPVDSAASANSICSFELRVGGVNLSLSGEVSFSCVKQLITVMEASC